MGLKEEVREKSSALNRKQNEVVYPKIVKGEKRKKQMSDGK